MKLLAIETWIAVVLSLLSFLAFRFITSFDDNFTMLGQEIAHLSQEMKKTNETMILINERQVILFKQLDDHEQRIRRVEIK